MGIPTCGICGLRTEDCKENPLCPRGVLLKKEWKSLNLTGTKYGNRSYVLMTDALEAMKEFALNYHGQFLTREVIFEKTKKHAEPYEPFKAQLPPFVSHSKYQ